MPALADEEERPSCLPTRQNEFHLPTMKSGDAYLRLQKEAMTHKLLTTSTHDIHTIQHVDVTRFESSCNNNHENRRGNLNTFEHGSPSSSPVRFNEYHTDLKLPRINSSRSPGGYSQAAFGKRKEHVGSKNHTKSNLINLERSPGKLSNLYSYTIYETEDEYNHECDQNTTNNPILESNKNIQIHRDVERDQYIEYNQNNETNRHASSNQNTMKDHRDTLLTRAFQTEENMLAVNKIHNNRSISQHPIDNILHSASFTNPLPYVKEENHTIKLPSIHQNGRIPSHTGISSSLISHSLQEKHHPWNPSSLKREHSSLHSSLNNLHLIGRKSHLGTRLVEPVGVQTSRKFPSPLLLPISGRLGSDFLTKDKRKRPDPGSAREE